MCGIIFMIGLAVFLLALLLMAANGEFGQAAIIVAAIFVIGGGVLLITKSVLKSKRTHLSHRRMFIKYNNKNLRK